MFASRNSNYDHFRSLKGGIFTIEGIIGVGKTTLGKSLVYYLNEIGLEAKFYPEYMNKDLLNQYIEDMKRYAYTFQMIMLCKRIEIYREAERYAATGGIAIIDRSIIGDMTFARMQKDNGNFTESEWQVYLSLMKQEIQLTPTKSLFLKCTPCTSMDRVKLRGIESEIKGYDIKYMEQLYAAYEISINECNNVNHIILEWDNPISLNDGYITNKLIKNILIQLI